jgi:predicted RNase H-like HicB family nuclease
MAEMKYRAVYEREPDGRWTVEVPLVPGCHTYGRTIEQARERIREALDLFVGDADTAEIVDDVRLPAGLMTEVNRAKRLREKVNRDQQSMTAAQAKAVVAMRKIRLGHRDAGRLLGLSHQRVQQLEKLQAQLTSARDASRRSAVAGASLQGASDSGRHAIRVATKKR